MRKDYHVTFFSVMSKILNTLAILVKNRKVRVCDFWLGLGSVTVFHRRRSDNRAGVGQCPSVHRNKLKCKNGCPCLARQK